MEYAPYMLAPWVIFSVTGLVSALLGACAMLLPGRAAWFIHLAIIIAFGLGTIVLSLRKARIPSSEQEGWQFFTYGMVVSFTANTLWLVLAYWPGMAGYGRVLPLVTNPMSGLLMALGVWKWPRQGREGNGTLCALGSLVFCISFLLLPWMKAGWVSGFDATPPLRILTLTLCSRLLLVGGLASFLISEDPRRLRGPLGWLLLNCSMLFVQMVIVAQGLNRLDLAEHSPLLALSPLVSAAMFLVPYTRQPAEAPQGEKPMPSYLPSLLLHLPFLAASTLLVVAVIGGHPPRPAVLLVFLAMTAALVLRQFLLQEQVAASHREMEARVAARTHDLEKMQDVVLLNERLNAVVVLGAGLVHDLNKGLGSILSAAEVLQMELERRMKVSGFAVEAIIQAVERSAVLSSRVMDFSRRLQEEGEVRDLRRELSALEGLLKLLVPCGIHLLLQPGQEPAPVRIHTEDLKQILVNLVANARDAMPPGGGTIRLAVGKVSRTGETYLDVEDTGIGIAPENREKLFEPFYTTKEPSQASGLGLASVKVLLDKAKGRVEVSSSIGAGTRFRLYFPSMPVEV